LSEVSESPAARWAAVVVNYNAGGHLHACVASVCADDSAGAAEIVVVDNASTDGSLAALREIESVHVVANRTNVGFAAGANRGIAASSAPIVAVINPDAVLHPGAAAALVTRLEHAPALGALGPRIDNVDGSRYPSARREPALVDSIGHGLLGAWWPENPATRRYREADVDHTVGRRVDWLSGAATFFRRDALDAIGGWDERFFMFMEDVDVCRRLRAAGWRVEYDPAAVVTHVEGVSRAHHPYRMIWLHHRAALRFAAKHWRGPRRLLLPLAAAVLTARAILSTTARLLSRKRRP
jgi:N-acetylglucosaminyl-diphospho-decaprenol L-rhamnosyltransferase